MTGRKRDVSLSPDLALWVLSLQRKHESFWMICWNAVVPLGRTVSPLFMCCYNMSHLFMYAFTQNAPSGVVVVVMPVRVWGSLENTLSNITALNENVLSTALWKCLGIEALQQQMLGQAVLSRLPFRGLTASVCQMMGVIPAPVPPSGPYTLILSSVLLQYGGG